MLVFILQMPNQIASIAQTELQVRKWLPDCILIKLQSNFAEQMNTALHTYRKISENDDFCLTLIEGENLSAHFADEIHLWINLLPPHTAGVVVKNYSLKGIPRGPILWRISALMDNRIHCGFTSLDWLPFEQYVLLDTAYQIDPNWSWHIVCSEHGEQALHPLPAWSKPIEEWNFINPIIHQPIMTRSSQLTPLITVVMCTHNDASTILWSIRSLLNQTYTRWELLLIDDASTDHTEEKLASVRSHPHINVIRNSTNHGKAYCLNYALSMARGIWMLELDADDWLAPNCLMELANQAQETPHAGVICANHVLWHERRNRQLILKESQPDPPFTIQDLLIRAMPRAPRMYQISVIKELGGWSCADPFEGRLFEDIQMLIKVAMSHPVITLDMSLYHRRLRGTSISQRNKEHYPAWASWMRTQLEKNRSSE
ncbi:glycosyltransferase family 2 protein [Paenibacillus sp. KN14-4R]|uniref:glycosyltransferase family 2 protein n=1 Tax=Paenibacillus sp. KN14-4R TaxID=3445773 RepID=UPI003FA0B385